MHARPSSSDYPPVVETYVSLVPDGDIADILTSQYETVTTLLQSLTEEQAGFRYAPGKWSLKEVIGHLIDNERIWAYRLLRIARSDPKELPGYDERIFTAHSPYDGLPLSDIRTEFALVRQSTLALLKALQPEAWIRQGMFGDHALTARAAAFVIAGHEAHHLNVIRERYLTA